MSVLWLSFTRLMVVAAISVCLVGCGRTETYRYKLTLAVDTPEGVKRGSSVVEVRFYEVSFPEKGLMHDLRGEALYLDLGPGAKPLIALLTSQLRPKDLREVRWSRDGGPHDNMLFPLYGVSRSGNILDTVRGIAAIRGLRKISPADLPGLVTFADINDPKSVTEVDPNDLQATLGPHIAWHEITLESTDEPVTTGIRAKLPWLSAYHGKMLDGDTLRHFGAKKALANTLGTADFQYPSDPKKCASSMATQSDLFLAILALGAYNRGYLPGITFSRSIGHSVTTDRVH
jgi:hypothetical protein